MSISNLAQTISDLATKIGTDLGALIKQFNGLPVFGATGKQLAQAATVQAAFTNLGLPYGSSHGFRNKVINGDFRVDQYKLAAFAPPVGGAYITDRWAVNVSQASKITVQRNPAWGITSPPGFPNYLVASCTTAYSPAANDYFVLQHRFEGLNTIDFGFGAAGASSIVLSFYICATIVGTYAGGISNSASNRSFAFTFSVTTTNTWQKITIPITGDTAGSWASDNTRSLILSLSLGAGSNYKTSSANTWLTANVVSTSGAVDLVANLNANFGITGVQLEAGSVATPFEFRPIGMELQLCQRYYWNKSSLYEHYGSGNGTAAGQAVGGMQFPTSMRAVPTMTSSTVTGNFNLMGAGGGYVNLTSLVFSNASTTRVWWTATVDAAYMTTGQATFLWSNTATAFIAASAEL